MKDERREIEETMTSAQPIEVGDDLRMSVGANEAAERMKRVKFRHARTRYGKDEDEEEEAIFKQDLVFLWFQDFEFYT